MNPKNRLSATRYRLLFSIAFFYLIISLVLRVVLWWNFGLPSHVSVQQLPAILGLGAINDFFELVYLLFPLSLYLFLVPQRLFQMRAHQWLLAICTFATLFGIIYLCFVEYYFFQEFDARFNLVSVDYLVYRSEVFVNIWDSYPIVRVVLSVFFASVIAFVFLWRQVKSMFKTTVTWRIKTGMLAIHAALLALVALAINTHTLDFSANRVANEITANGPSSFFQALNTYNLNYNDYYRVGNPKKMLALLKQNLALGGGRFVSTDPEKINRAFPANPKGLGKFNVVVITEESLSAKFVGAYGGKNHLTPNFDALAKHGLLFTNMYATGTRTVRGLEAITTSLPPIPTESIIKRPNNENIANWGTIMKKQGYSATFLYGGYGYFDNMNYFYSHNGFDIRDRSNIKKVTFSNIWGVSDEDLFRYAVSYFNQLSKTKKPFFAIMMSTSNHKPYTFPSGIPGVLPQNGGRFSGVRYADYAIGKFFKWAKTQPWFDHTIFVIVADHDARVYGSEQIPVSNYRIPLLIYAPKYIAPRKVNILTSQMDIAPTLLGMLGFSYEAPFFGQDVLHWNAKIPRTIFLNHDHDVAMGLDNQFAVLGLLRKTNCYDYDPKTQQLKSIPINPMLLNLATAYYQTAFELYRDHKYTF